ncbi:sensor histidine kinase [Rhodopila sp.]|uniref:sensor histidine kinase n=1 Tax=Rhodopila sp. TaxID=2480087 RepID=UPI003D14E0F2
MTGFDRSKLMSAAAMADMQPDQSDSLHARKLAALGELASGITHDFRNILQTVMSTLELLECRSDDPAEVRRLTAQALRASERGIGLTGRLLRFSRRDPTGARPVSLLASMETITETLARTVETRTNVRIKSPDGELWPVVIDPDEFELALINVALNARDAMPNGGRIELAARNVTIPMVDRRVSGVAGMGEASRGAASRAAAGRRRNAERRGPRLPLPGGDYVAISVADTGVGMDAATLARAVEPFFTTKPVGKGTGLGLASVQDLARLTRGALRLKSRPGQGTVVELWLPRAAASDRPLELERLPAAMTELT